MELHPQDPAVRQGAYRAHRFRDGLRLLAKSRKGSLPYPGGRVEIADIGRKIAFPVHLIQVSVLPGSPDPAVAEAESPHQIILPEIPIPLQIVHVHVRNRHPETVVNLPAHPGCGQGAQQALQKLRASGLREIPLLQVSDQPLCQGAGHHQPLRSPAELIEQPSVPLQLLPLRHGEQSLHPLPDFRGFLVDGFLVIVLIVIDDPGTDAVYFRSLLLQSVLAEEQLLHLGKLSQHLFLQGSVQTLGAAVLQLPEGELLVQEFQHTFRQPFVLQPLDIELHPAFAAALVIRAAQLFAVALIEVMHLS